ncbi:hypothetical protein EHQ53_08685 [Leptospira langatensis]|uniref:DUF5683 domain-containing protein n=1 Tax=Leptospira langatensis TaxID=2484983 RepID=A0A5F1ZVF8_9LEPT|nr:hypothetical protein [Leptospira langatensis]TGK01295.1 hypothetical protein EHO57_10185 [Leptospira langatensis]TGL42252.1 hypothetical protein EHQ53_08685 [Leptospira langatensis]
MRRIILALLCFAPILSSYAEPVSPTLEQESRSRWDLVWRSAVLPGWGLIHAKAYRKGFITLAVTSALVGIEYRAHHKAEMKKEDWEDAKTLSFAYLASSPQADPQTLLGLSMIQENRHHSYEDTKQQNNLKLGLLTLKYCLQLAYTYWYGIQWEKEDLRSGLKMDLAPDASGNWERAGLGWTSYKAALGYTFVF